jgi:hypothetical protein
MDIRGCPLEYILILNQFYFVDNEEDNGKEEIEDDSKD